MKKDGEESDEPDDIQLRPVKAIVQASLPFIAMCKVGYLRRISLVPFQVSEIGVFANLPTI